LVEELVPPPDPVECCERLSALPYRLFLDSATPGARLGRYSFLMADPAVVVRSKGRRCEQVDLVSGEMRLATRDALTAARDLLEPHRTPSIAGLPPFQGGAAGYIAYDFGLTLDRLPAPRHDDLALFDTVLGLYDWVLAWDHVASRAWVISTGAPETDASARRARAAERLAYVSSRVNAPRRAAGAQDAGVPDEATGPQQPGPEPAEPFAPSFPVDRGWWSPRLDLRSSFTRQAYLAAVARVREYIFAGDIFQANLSQRFEVPLVDRAWDIYRRLRARNPAPFAAYMDLPDATILSASPERFLRVDATRRVETRPIKGPRRRGVGPHPDPALGQALTESAKDRAENLMIVDLMRNDLSRVCTPGSVRVSVLFALEHYATVHHLVSTVVGELAPGLDGLDLLRAAFPGGSITGAPKLRAMEVIAELEPSQRGVYCGSIGYMSFGGEFDTSIVIRTAVVRGRRVYFSAGGGIVADSDPEQEYLETLHKARALIDVFDTGT
jgi:para-aminobenzoate synthetase component 1